MSLIKTTREQVLAVEDAARAAGVVLPGAEPVAKPTEVAFA